jgi:hypothetical protein
MSVASTSRARSSSSLRARSKAPGDVRSPSAGASAPARVRWDRLGRVAMLCVLVALVYLYASTGAHMLSTWRQSRHDDAAVAAMEREHRLLVRQHESLTGSGTLEAEARQLGMMKPGEQPYVISGLPDN